MIERVELPNAIVLVGEDASALGNAARAAVDDAAENRQVLVWVGPADAPELAEMLHELRARDERTGDPARGG